MAVDSHAVTKISQSKFVAGAQCLKRLYWQVHETEVAAQPDASAEAITGAREGAREAWVSFDKTRYASRFENI
jgi:hypothetical protein